VPCFQCHVLVPLSERGPVTVNNNGTHEIKIKTEKKGEGKGDTVTVDNNGKHKVEHKKELHSTAHTCTNTHI
jgi:hypothetical protein